MAKNQAELNKNLTKVLTKITDETQMCEFLRDLLCGALTLEELRDKAKITLVSAVSIVEGGAHDVQLKDSKK